MNVGGLGSPFGQAQLGFLCGLDEVRHENLETGERRVWRRPQLGMAADAGPNPDL